MLRRHQGVAVHAGIVLHVPAADLRGGGGGGHLGAVQQGSCGEGGDRVLQADLQQLQGHPAGGAQGDPAPHPLWPQLLRAHGHGDRRRQGHLPQEGGTGGAHYHEMPGRHRRGVQQQAAHHRRRGHRHRRHHDLRHDLQHDALLRHQEIQRLCLTPPPPRLPRASSSVTDASFNPPLRGPRGTAILGRVSAWRPESATLLSHTFHFRRCARHTHKKKKNIFSLHVFPTDENTLTFSLF